MAAGRIRVVSFNLRNSAAPDGINVWQNRKPLAKQILESCHPDVAGFQEVLVDQLQDLEGILPDYKHIGAGRVDGKQRGEFVPIFFRHLKAAAQGTFWLSDTPDVPSNTWGGQHRICTWIIFNDVKPFAVFNTHLESDFAEARAQSVPLLLARIQEVADGMPVLLLGDFNFKPNSREYRQLSREFLDTFGFTTGMRNNVVTSHSFSGRRWNLFWRWGGEGRIDYIWVRGQVEVLESRIIYDQPDSDSRIYPSDHWPILADVVFG